jgi:hypothetical protein
LTRHGEQDVEEKLSVADFAKGAVPFLLLPSYLLLPLSCSSCFLLLPPAPSCTFLPLLLPPAPSCLLSYLSLLSILLLCYLLSIDFLLPPLPSLWLILPQAKKERGSQ